MRTVRSLAQARLQGYALTHDRTPLFSVLLLGLALIWSLGAAIGACGLQ